MSKNARVTRAGTLTVRNWRAVTSTRPAILLLFVAGSLGVSGLGISSAWSGIPVGSGLLAKAQNLAAMLSERSPGVRTAGELTKTKRKLADAKPHERALGKIRRPVLPPEFLRALVPGVDFADAVPTTNLNPLIGLPAPQFALEVGPPAGGIGSVPGTPGVPIPGGGGVILTPPSSGTPVPTPISAPSPIPAPAVPEPGTWAMMLMGFVCLGMKLKRDRARIAAPLLSTT